MYKYFTNTYFLGKKILFKPSCQSTNEELQTLLLENPLLEEGFLVYTQDQKAGKGQQGSTWHSEPGKNLTFSLLLCPHFLEAEKSYYLSMAIANALHETCTELSGKELKIKWPNDLYSENKKLSGILIESQLHGTKLKSAIVGIGLNLNQATFPLDTASSLHVICNKTFDPEQALEKLLCKIEKYYWQLKASKFAEIRSYYHTHLLGFQEERHFENLKHPHLPLAAFTGVIYGVDEKGLLCIEIENKMHKFEPKTLAMKQ